MRFFSSPRSLAKDALPLLALILIALVALGATPAPARADGGSGILSDPLMFFFDFQIYLSALHPGRTYTQPEEDLLLSYFVTDFALAGKISAQDLMLIQLMQLETDQEIFP